MRITREQIIAAIAKQRLVWTVDEVALGKLLPAELDVDATPIDAPVEECSHQKQTAKWVCDKCNHVANDMQSLAADALGPRHSVEEIEELIWDDRDTFRQLQMVHDKLNEVIRFINKQGKVK